MACNTFDKLNISRSDSPSIFPRLSHVEATKKEAKQTPRERRRGWGGYRKPLTPPRPMPWRLYRFTTERRTSVNRYLLTLDFPWPPPTRPTSPPLHPLKPQPSTHGVDIHSLCHLSFSLRSLALRGSVSSVFLLPTFHPSATAVTLPREEG